MWQLSCYPCSDSSIYLASSYRKPCQIPHSTTFSLMHKFALTKISVTVKSVIKKKKKSYSQIKHDAFYVFFPEFIWSYRWVFRFSHHPAVVLHKLKLCSYTQQVSSRCTVKSPVGVPTTAHHINNVFRWVAQLAFRINFFLKERDLAYV